MLDKMIRMADQMKEMADALEKLLKLICTNDELTRVKIDELNERIKFLEACERTK